MPPDNWKMPSEAPLSRTPAYHQLQERLRTWILSGEWTAGSRFPTERALADRFGVSRVTANKALSQLVMEGLLQFRPGVGTFIRPEALSLELGTLVSFTQKASKEGRMPSTEVLAFQRLPGIETRSEILEELQIGTNGSVFEIRRVRKADGIPVILEHRWINAGLCPDLKAEDLVGSLYQRLRSEPGLVLTGADQRIQAVRLEPEEARILDTESGAAALRVHAVGHSNRGAVWVEDTLYRGDLYGIANTIRMDGSPRPARISSLPSSKPSTGSPRPIP